MLKLPHTGKKITILLSCCDTVFSLSIINFFDNFLLQALLQSYMHNTELLMNKPI